MQLAAEFDFAILAAHPAGNLGRLNQLKLGFVQRQTLIRLRKAAAGFFQFFKLYPHS